MICPSCQHENNDADETCFACGRRVASSVTVTRGTVVAERYEIQSQLGRGGMGIVYKAHDRVLDEDVAIKLLRPDIAQTADLARRFRSEIKLARRVTHKNVCRIHEYDQDGGLRYISMELIEGQDLRKLLRSRPLTAREAFDFAIQIASGLDAIHDAGIIHRDLKTPNIMLDARGAVKLMDFGIAKSATAETNLGATTTGQIIGTPEYMSPEQAQGGTVDVRSDVYALGIVLFEIFTGQVPFRGDTPLNTILKHIHEPVPLAGPPAERLPPALIPVLRKALAKDPAERYANGGETLVALRAAQTAFAHGPSATAVTESGGARARLASAPTVQLRPEAGGTSTPVVRRPTVLPAHQPAVRRPSLWLWLLPVVVGCGAGLVFLGLRAWTPRGGPVPDQQVSRLEASPLAAVVAVPAGPVAEPTPIRDDRTPPPVALATPPARPAPTAVAVESPRRDARPRPDVPASRPGPGAAPASPHPTAAAPVPVQSTPAPAAQAPAHPAVAEERGFLQVTVVPGADLVVDGNALGPVTSRKIPLAAGAHVVRLLHPEYQPLQRKVTILPGETARIVVDLAEEAIRKKN